MSPAGPAAPPGSAGNALSGPGAGARSPAVVSAPSVDAAPGGAITRHARPQGGYQVRPSYPASARRLGIQGTSLLKVQVLLDGRVGEVVVQESAGHPDLDQAAADAVRRWRFDPARRGADPVAVWVLLPVEFRIR
jgi:protein TonB